jgi:hypothetical protein
LKKVRFAHALKTNDCGSENNYQLDWYNEVEIYPSVAIFVPTKSTRAVTARSKKGLSGSLVKPKGKFAYELRTLPPRE